MERALKYMYVKYNFFFFFNIVIDAEDTSAHGVLPYAEYQDNLPWL